jgi:NADPH-dependent 2,4-dienoyl-CoA reductase/sulfur reductase-like enzyme
VTKILIVGGGYAGFTTARQLEKQLNPGEAQVTLVDPLPYMTYQPFRPEGTGGSIEPRHAVVSLRRHLKRTRVITAEVTKIDHASKTATITPEDGDDYTLGYDIVVVTAGNVSRVPDSGYRRQRRGHEARRRGRLGSRHDHRQLQPRVDHGARPRALAPAHVRRRRRRLRRHRGVR